MFLSRITAVFISVSCLGLLTFLFLFLKFNAPGLTSFKLITAIAVIYCLIYTIASVRLVTRLWAKRLEPESRRMKPFLACAVLFLYNENQVNRYLNKST